MKRISLHIAEERLEWIDEKRGELTRAEFIRKAIDRDYRRRRKIEIEVIKAQMAEEYKRKKMEKEK